MAKTQSTQTPNISAPTEQDDGTAPQPRHRFRVLQVLRRRDSVTFARRWPGKVLVAVVLLFIPVFMLFWSLRADRYTDNSWQAVLMAAVLVVAYVATRRLVVTVTVGVLAVAAVTWALTPDLANDGTGDPSLLAQLDHERNAGGLAGLQDVAVAKIDVGARQPVRVAGLGADANTPMEVGSITKAMTGLVIADAVERGEVRMHVPVATYLALPLLFDRPPWAATRTVRAPRQRASSWGRRRARSRECRDRALVVGNAGLDYSSMPGSSKSSPYTEATWSRSSVVKTVARGPAQPSWLSMASRQ
jgi:hypothetical protein